MNANEVIANRANELLGGKHRPKKPVHPNDHVNRGQSSNDTLPDRDAHRRGASRSTAPAAGAERLREALDDKAEAFAGIVKIGRTHLQDATPLTLGQEFSGYAAQVEHGIGRVEAALAELHAAGAGRHRRRHRAQRATRASPRRSPPSSRRLTGLPFVSARQQVRGAGRARRAWSSAHGALNTLAAALFKIANDIRLLGSGPRCGLGELILPENEPGSSIMPGKVNPTQAEALTMVCGAGHGQPGGGHLRRQPGPSRAQRLQAGDRRRHAAIDPPARRRGARASPTIASTGIEANEKRIAELLERSLMLVTALAPGDRLRQRRQDRQGRARNGTTLREEALRLGLVDAETFDRVVDARKMISPEGEAHTEWLHDTRATAYHCITMRGHGSERVRRRSALFLKSSRECGFLMAEIINLRRARKDRSRAEREERAASNRLKFGRSRADRETSEAEKRLADRRLDGHRLSEAPEPVRDENEEPSGETLDRDRGA